MSVNWRSIIDDLNSSKSLVVAISGGKDSMFLLDFVMRNFNGTFKVAHFNHNVRNTSSRDENFVVNFCTKNKIPYKVGYGNKDVILSASSIEAECRNQRYKFLENVRKQDDSEFIVTAHHLNDQVETVLLRLMRGVPHNALAMEKFSGKIWRPFLEVSVDDIKDQIEQRSIPYIDDETNFDNRYERNWLRNDIIPRLMTRRNLTKTIPKGIIPK